MYFTASERLNLNMKQYLILFSVIAISCHNKTDFESEEKAIRNLLQQERKAHFEKNVDLFAASFPGDAIMVNKGKVSQPSIEEFKRDFKRILAASNL